MDLDFFADPGLAPKPRNEIRIEDLSLAIYPDRRRVRVDLELTPFAPADRPNLEITVHNASGAEVSSTSIIDAIQRKISLTMHIRETSPEDEYTFQVDLYYRDEPVQHSAQQTIDLSAQSGPMENL